MKSKSKMLQPRALHCYMRRPRHQMPAQGGWSVPDLCAAYDWPTGLAGGGVIGIVELGGGWVPADLEKFFGEINQPIPHVTDVSVGGSTNTPGVSDADGEVALDIEVAGAAYFAATGHPATIRMYWATDIATGVRAAIADKCQVITISWGADEAVWGDDAADDMEAAAAEAVEAGCVVLAASGDNDSSDGGPNAANVDLPAGCPSVLGCGGTSKPATGPEVVWNNNPGQTMGSGTGGGYSTIFPVEPWQIGAPPAPAGLGRMIPDVSANADPQTGYQVVVRGQWQIIGGTSAVAPLWAGLLAACAKPGVGHPISWLFWANQQAFADITHGDNGTYSAAVGPDPCSGIGTPKGSAVAALMAVATPHLIPTRPVPGAGAAPGHVNPQSRQK